MIYNIYIYSSDRYISGIGYNSFVQVSQFFASRFKVFHIFKFGYANQTISNRVYHLFNCGQMCHDSSPRLIHYFLPLTMCGNEFLKHLKI